MTAPIIASFSGGRSSAVMVAEMLRRGSRLDAIVFCNTTMESELTLDFVELFDKHIVRPAGKRVHWLEYRHDRNAFPKTHYVDVCHKTARRNSESFLELTEAVRRLPSPRYRVCTEELKVRTINRFANKNFGRRRIEKNAIGLRADEPRRVARMNKDRAIAPLYEWGIDRAGVMEIVRSWKWAEFAHNEDAHLSNCEGCFFGKLHEQFKICRDNPKRAKEWAEIEIRHKKFVRRPATRMPPERVAAYRKVFGKYPPQEEADIYAIGDLSWQAAIEASAKPNQGGQLNFPVYPTGCGAEQCGLDIVPEE